MDRVQKLSTPSAAVPSPPSAGSELIGQTIGDYEILRRLGAGGMGQVYLARQNSLNRHVAFKVLRSDLAADAVSLQRFKGEAEAAARVVHANIVQVYAVGTQGGLRYLAMEYVEGWNLREYVEGKGRPGLPLALSIMRQTAVALQRAAEAGIVHRDLKPENILLNRKGEVKVADFGLSRCLDETGAPHLTETGVALGTPLFMSPEQVRGQPVDPRSDLYSFGATCYYLLAGLPPFAGQTGYEIALHHVQTPPRPLAELCPDLPAALCAVVDRLLAKRPEDRYQTAREVFRELTRVREGLSGGTSIVPTLKARRPAWVRELLDGIRASHPGWRWTAAASVLLALVGGVALGWRSGAPVAASAPPPVVAAAEPEIPLQQRRVQFLLDEVKETALPGTDRERMIRGIEARLELGLLYLDAWRLDEANQFFNALTHGTDQPGLYRLLGRIGHALVLAFSDRAAESNKMLADIFGEPKQVYRPNREWLKASLVNRHPGFHRKIAEAIDRNAINGQTLTPELRELRKPKNYVPHAPTTSQAKSPQPSGKKP